MDNEYSNLDDDWICEFEKTDKLYEDFYKDNLYYVNLRVIYVNRENEIDKIKHESFLLNNKNKISQEEILGILKKNSIDNDRKYSLLSILRYNIVLEPDDIKNYLVNNNNPEYLSIIKNIDDIMFDKSITMFHDLNDLILIFYEKSTELIKHNSTNNTKKIYLRSLNTNKKTIRKRYKA
jgi:hypothetical protein